MEKFAIEIADSNLPKNALKNFICGLRIDFDGERTGLSSIQLKNHDYFIFCYVFDKIMLAAG